MVPQTVIAQSSDGVLPSDAASGVVWGIMVAVILGLYFLIRRTRRRAAADYWDRGRREQEIRDNDPDMHRPEH